MYQGSAQQSVQPLGPDEFSQLPAPFQAALLVRMVLRLTPLFAPGAKKTTSEQRREVLALEGGAARAMTALRGAREARLSPALERARDTLAPSTKRKEPVGSSYVATLASLAISQLERPGPAMLPRAPRQLPTLESIQAADRADADVLASLGVDDPVPEEFWKRPLWPEATASDDLWSSVLESWRGRLVKLDLEEIYSSYVVMAFSSGDSSEAIEKRITLWKAELEAAPRRGVRLQMLADGTLANEADDRLGFKAYADALAGLIDNPKTGTPFTLAINGPWGAGKSTLARMIQRRLEGKPAANGVYRHVTCWFNSWMHDEATDLAAAFAAEVARSADRLRPTWRRLLRPLPLSMLSSGQRLHRRVAFWSFVVVLAGVVAYYNSAEGMFELLLRTLGIKGEDATKLAGAYDKSALFAFVAAVLVLVPQLSTMARSLSEFVRDPQASATVGVMTRVREQLGRLIHEATPAGSRFVVFVDDLERCRPPRSVEVLEVVNQLLCHPEVVVVVMADMAAVAACAEIKYEKLAQLYSPENGRARPDEESRGSEVDRHSYGRLYLQKIVQLQFDLPPLRDEKIRRLIESLAELEAARREAPGTPVTGQASLRNRAAELGQALAGDWSSIYLADLRAALARRPWPQIPSAVVSSVLLLPIRWAELLASRAVYGPSAQSLQSEPGRSAALLALARVALDAAFVLAIIQATLAVTFGWYRALDPNVAGWLPSWLLVAGVAAALRAVIPVRAAAATIRKEGWRTPPAQLFGPAKQTLVEVAQLTAAAALVTALSTGISLALGRDAVLLSPWWLCIGSILVIVAATACLAAVGAWSQRRRDISAIRKVRRISEEALAKGLDETDIQAEIRSARLRSGSDELIREAVQLHLVNESPMLSVAEEEIMPFLPPLPRNAKRVLNHLRLLLFIAHQRKILGGAPELSPRHLGKWVVLRERWPEIAQRLFHLPAEAAMAETQRLETLASSNNGTFTHDLAALVPATAADPALRTFYSSETRLAEIVDRLLYLDTA